MTVAQFSLAFLIIELIAIVAAAAQYKFKPFGVVAFGTALPAGNASFGANRVPIGVDLQGQTVFAPVSLRTPMYANDWSNNHAWTWLAFFVQFIVMILVIASMSADNWTYFVSPTMFGNVTASYGLFSTRASFLGTITTSTKGSCATSDQACNTLYAASVVIVITGIVCAISAAILAWKMLAVANNACCTRGGVHARITLWMPAVCMLQLITMTIVIFTWALCEHIIINSNTSSTLGGSYTLTFGNSWSIFVASWLLTALIYLFLRHLIAHRSSGDPVYRSNAVSQVIIVQQPQVIQPAFVTSGGYMQPMQQQQMMQMQPQQPVQYMNQPQQPVQYMNQQPQMFVNQGQYGNQQQQPTQYNQYGQQQQSAQFMVASSYPPQYGNASQPAPPSYGPPSSSSPKNTISPKSKRNNEQIPVTYGEVNKR